MVVDQRLHFGLGCAVRWCLVELGWCCSAVGQTSSGSGSVLLRRLSSRPSELVSCHRVRSYLPSVWFHLSSSHSDPLHS